jgi:small-conductance mechanosensitive channel
MDPMSTNSGAESGGDSNILHFIDLDRLPYAILVVIVAVIASRTVRKTLDGLGERIAERRLFFKQVTAISRFSILVVATFMVFGSLLAIGDNREVLLAIIAPGAVAIGLALKDLLASLMAGIILLFDRPFQVGDRVRFGDTYGEVKEIGLRAVRLVTLDDNLVSIPNNRFLNDSVASANAGALHQMCVMDFYIGCNEDFETAKRLVYEATASSRYVYLNLPIVVHLREGPVPDGAERFAIRLICKAYVLDGRYESAFATDVTERVKRAFRQQAIRTAGEIEWEIPSRAS